MLNASSAMNRLVSKPLPESRTASPAVEMAKAPATAARRLWNMAQPSV